MIYPLSQFMRAALVFCLLCFGLKVWASPNLVLLPIDVSETEAELESEYGSALQQGLQKRYTVFYGPAVEKELEKEYGKIDCNTETCNQNVAIAFNGELIADSSVKAINGGYVLKLVIRNVISGKVIETETVPCEDCNSFSVIRQLKQIGAGTLNETNNVGSTGQSATKRVTGQATPMASEERAILIFDSQPTGAAITINGKASGKTPYQGLSHKIGEQLRIELKDPRYRSYELEVSLNQAITQLEPLILEAGQGKVMIVTDPYQANAVVYLDDKAQGAAPVQVSTIAGIHQIYAQDGNQKTAVKTLTLNDGESKQVVLDFSSQDPLLKELGITMVDIPAGSFSMGSNVGYKWEKPAHQVTLSAFQLAQYEITQGQWQAVMGSNPSHFKNCGYTCPVEKVSWEGVQAFIHTLNQKTGGVYRLPTEAEWEYACRSGGKSQQYCGGNDLGVLAWRDDNSNTKTHPVGQKLANGLGLYDMSGNVWEWVQDWYDDYLNKSLTDPTGPANGTRRILRGGGWVNDTSFSRSTFRIDQSPGYFQPDVGFRLAR